METPRVKILELVFMWADIEKEKSWAQTGFLFRENPGRRERRSHCLAGFLLVLTVLCALEGQAQNWVSFVHVPVASTSLRLDGSSGPQKDNHLREGLFPTLVAAFESVPRSQGSQLKQLSYCQCY